VKVFPARSVGAPDYFKAVTEPLPNVEPLPSGGADFKAAPKYIKAGAIAVAVGGAVVGNELPGHLHVGPGRYASFIDVTAFRSDTQCLLGIFFVTDQSIHVAREPVITFRPSPGFHSLAR
jgi:KDPG/KHG aldolase